MPCESCAVQFSVFKRKRACLECERYYCGGCLRRGGGAMCAPCRVLSTRPLNRQNIAHLKVRDLQCFLQRQNVSTRGCVEKEELLNLCVSHVNSASYRRRGPRAGAGAFSTLKGFTSNINEFINSAFDIRNGPHPAPPPTNSNCYNSSHTHTPLSQSTASPTAPMTNRFTTTPGGEQPIHVPVPETPESTTESTESVHVDTADCFEIEDVNDAGWEFVHRPADPLPDDSDVVLRLWSETESPQRATSELQLAREIHAHADTVSLHDQQIDEPASQAHRLTSEELHPNTTAENRNTEIHTTEAKTEEPTTPRHITLDQMKEESDLEVLNVKQLKELLARNRVEYRGCLERKDLLQRARMLWRDHVRYKDEIDSLPLEDCCKICMSAALECVLLECGHMAACTGCAKQLAECPICRQYVVRAVRVFRS